MAGRCIADTDFTADWVVSKILEDIGEKTNPKLKGWDAKHISVGQGFVSRIFKLKLEWEEKNPELPDSVVLKVPTTATVNSSVESMEASKNQDTEDVMEMVVEIVMMGHANECEFYSIFNHIGIGAIPHLYYGSPHTREKQGIIIMDDLSATSGNIDLAAGLNKSQIMQALDVIATVQAYSLNNKGWEGTLKPMSRKQLESMPPMLKISLSQLKTMKPEYFSHAEEQIDWMADPDLLYELCTQSHEKVGLPAVIVHGDLWANNLMFKKMDGVIGNKLEAVIDWQIAHPGNFAEDISRLLISSCSPELRHAELENLLLFYMEKLNKYLGFKHKEFTFEKMMMAYNIIFAYSTLFFVANAPILANSPVVEGPEKEEKVEALMRRAKTAIEDAAVLKKNFKN